MTNTELIHIMLLWLLGIVIDILFIYIILKEPNDICNILRNKWLIIYKKITSMKKLTILAMFPFLLSSCGSDATEIPDVNPSNGNNTEKPDANKKSPTLADIIQLNKTIADAFKNKPTASKEDLEFFMDTYNYSGCTYANNKYHITFKNGVETVLDLNGYTSPVERSSKSSSRSSRTGNQQTTTPLSNTKVLFWEAGPFGPTLYDTVGELVESYVGADHVTTLFGADCTWQSLMTLSEYATVIINGLGFNAEWIVTGQEYITAFDHSSVQDYISVYSAVVDGVLKHYYMVKHTYISLFVAPLNTSAIVFNASASGGVSSTMAQAFNKAGFTAYLGFDNMVTPDWAAAKAAQFFDAMITGRATTGQAVSGDFLTASSIKIDDRTELKVGMTFTGDTSLTYPFSAQTDEMAVKSILKNYGLEDESVFDQLITENRLKFSFDNRIQYLDLSGMGLTGEISSDFDDLDELVLLNLSENELTGNIPEFMGEYKNMTSLNLSNNLLSGNIPESFARYYDNKRYINLSYNQMQGMIPFGKYTDNNTFFYFDRRYIYVSDGQTIDNKTGLWYADEPIQ